MDIAYVAHRANGAGPLVSRARGWVFGAIFGARPRLFSAIYSAGPVVIVTFFASVVAIGLVAFAALPFSFLALRLVLGLLVPAPVSLCQF